MEKTNLQKAINDIDWLLEYIYELVNDGEYQENEEIQEIEKDLINFKKSIDIK